MKNVIALIIDEYSMISSNLFFWTSTRVQEATNCHGLIFKRLPTIIFGDPGQLPPVAGTQLWCSQTISNRALKPLALQGHNIYMNIKAVMYLTNVRRQQGLFKEFLLRLRDGKVTSEDWQYLNLHCASECMDTDRKRCFETRDTTYLYTTNEDCNKKNNEMIITLHKPICRMDAEHDSDTTRTKSSDSCRRLLSTLYLCVGCKIILT